MRAPKRSMRRKMALASLAALFVAPMSAPAIDGESPFTASGPAGSGVAVMQAVAMPARIGRVAVVPGTGGAEAWAIGLSNAPLYTSQSPGGQVVFLHYRKGSGWKVTGPALDADGRAFDPTLYGMAIAPSGEGWAVGADGAMLHKPAGSEAWRLDPSASEVAGQSLINAVSFAPTSATGYAVGENGTVLKYAGGTWTREPPAPAFIEGGQVIDLAAVAAVSADEAWATSGSGFKGVRVYRRAGGTWTSVPPDADTDHRIFAGPFPATGANGGATQTAYAASVAADATGAWVGGAIVPVDALHPTGNDIAGERSQPFVIHFDAQQGAPTSYCADQYSLRQQPAGNDVDRTRLCARPFPLAAYDITSIAIASGGHVFAGGLGLFHFRSGAWNREPDSIGYIASLSLASATEGWAATTGNTYGGGAAVHSSEPILGHWTSKPEKARVARWPQPNERPLHGVAISPRGDAVLAVGERGALVEYVPDVGWDTVAKVANRNLHAVVWSGPDEAWAVGENGVILHRERGRWTAAPESEALTKSSLFGVAFTTPDDGVAVGVGGTILKYDGTRWRTYAQSGVVTDETLFAVAMRGDDAVAVGGEATIIERTARGWRRVSGIDKILSRPRLRLPDLYAVTITDDDHVVAGGERSALVARAPGGAFQPLHAPVEGAVLALASGRSERDGAVKLVASVSPDDVKFREEDIGATRSALLFLDRGAWRDISLSRRRTTYPLTEIGAFDDPAIAIAMSPDGEAGWAVGGFPADTNDDDGHLRTDATSSIYRFDLGGESGPAPPALEPSPDIPRTGINVAVFGDVWCGRGLCSSTMGAGTQADEVAVRIQREIAMAGAYPNGPPFALFTGSGRGTGVPEELGELKAYLRGFATPVFGALGSRDLFSAVDNSPADGALGVAESSPYSSRAAAQAKGGANVYWKEVLAGFPAPWGRAPSPPWVQPRPITGGTDRPELARTHYAFDYAPGGVKKLRVVVLDSSTFSYGDPADQNPSLEDQGEWLKATLLDARTANGGRPLPSIVVMNQPTLYPDKAPGQFNWTGGPGGRGTSDAAAFAGSVYDPPSYGVSAVLSGGVRMAVRDAFPSRTNPVVPSFVLGTGGAPLGYEPPNPTVEEPSLLASDGFYHSWFLVNVDPSVRPEAGLPGMAAVRVIAFPAFESIAMHAQDGHEVAAGSTLRFSGLARGLSGGFSDPDQSRSTYFRLGTDAPPECESVGQGNGFCSSKDAVRPSYRFFSEDPSIADFVLPDFGLGDRQPQRIAGKIARDPTGEFGLLCGFKPGTTFVNLVSGFHRARMKVTVGAGFGLCVDKPAVIPDEPKVKPRIIQRPQFVPERPLHRVPLQPQQVALLPPPPVPVVAPAPPAAPGVGRKEEEEYSPETEGHGEDRHHFTAYQSVRGENAVPQPVVVLGGLLIVAFGAAAVAARTQQRRMREARAWAWRDR